MEPNFHTSKRPHNKSPRRGAKVKKLPSVSTQSKLSVRSSIAKVIYSVFTDGKNLTEAFNKELTHLSAQDASLASEICYGVMRYRLRLEFFVSKLLTAPLKSNQQLLLYLLCTGIYQLEYTQIPPYAAINETVNAVDELGLSSYKALTNAILREFLRQHDNLVELAQKSYETLYSCPQWLILELKKHYKPQLPQILANMNSHPPMWIRVNKLKYTCTEYKLLLKQNNIDAVECDEVQYALRLSKAVGVDALPNFQNGSCFVQDAAAQYAAILLDAQPDDLVLDCCCAPGGKTTHIRELYPDIKDLVAIDSQSDRISRVHDNLKRMHQQAKVVCYDAGAPYIDWSPYPQYDRILLDAPCSATGVIRRHPDIKWLRTPDDITDIIKLQKRILNNMWSMLKPGGILVYATCSIMYDENAGNIKDFLALHDDALLLPISEGEDANHPGKQRLPGDNDMDGFYYARLQKKA